MIFDGKPFVPHPNGRLMTPYTLDMEREFFEVRSELAREYGVLNRLNRVTVRSEDDWIGIAACGTRTTRCARRSSCSGSPTTTRCAAGIRLFQLLMPVPLEPAQVREFAHGLTEVIVVEEKNPTLERLVRDALYDWDERPAVVGRHDDQGRPLIPAGAIDADQLIEPLRARLAARLDDVSRRPAAGAGGRGRIALSVERAPFFCSGCPHNTSTRVAPGTLVGGGIGCHAMVGLMEAERVGDLVGLTCMGNEGAQWIGMAPFLERKHLVQNLGDGTFFHSGSLAIRAAVAAGVDITFKLLHNGTVAMTGGQDAVGAVGVPDSPRWCCSKASAR